MINRHPMHQRMTEWAFWITAAGEGKVGAMGFSKCTLADWRSGDGYDGGFMPSNVPINAIECRRTHTAILELQPHLQEILFLYFVRALTLRVLAVELRISSPSTAQIRVLAAMDAAEHVIHTVS